MSKMFKVAKKKQEILDFIPAHPFRLIAVSSSHNLHKLIWSINASCGTKFLQNIDLETTYNFPVFSDKTTIRGIIISLIPNKQNGELFVKQLPNVDFIVEVNGSISETEYKKFIATIKKVEGILAAIDINPQTIKRKEPFCPE